MRVTAQRRFASLLLAGLLVALGVVLWAPFAVADEAAAVAQPASADVVSDDGVEEPELPGVPDAAGSPPAGTVDGVELARAVQEAGHLLDHLQPSAERADARQPDAGEDIRSEVERSAPDDAVEESPGGGDAGASGDGVSASGAPGQGANGDGQQAPLLLAPVQPVRRVVEPVAATTGDDDGSGEGDEGLPGEPPATLPAGEPAAWPASGEGDDQGGVERDLGSRAGGSWGDAPAHPARETATALADDMPADGGALGVAATVLPALAGLAAVGPAQQAAATAVVTAPVSAWVRDGLAREMLEHHRILADLAGVESRASADEGADSAIRSPASQGNEASQEAEQAAAEDAVGEDRSRELPTPMWKRNPRLLGMGMKALGALSVSLLATSGQGWWAGLAAFGTVALARWEHEHLYPARLHGAMVRDGWEPGIETAAVKGQYRGEIAGYVGGLVLGAVVGGFRGGWVGAFTLGPIGAIGGMVVGSLLGDLHARWAWQRDHPEQTTPAEPAPAE